MTVGSTFSFDIPLTKVKGNWTPHDTLRQGQVHLKQQDEVHALVVDDIEINRVMLANILEELGCRISLAKDGIDALSSIKLDRPDIVFMDIVMPRMSGENCILEIRKTDPNLVCVAASGEIEKNDLCRLGELGFNDCISKPYCFEQITQCMSNNLNIKFETD